MELKQPLDDLQKRRLIYSKFLFEEGRNYLLNESNDWFFNVSVILLANSVEIFLQTLFYCVTGIDKYREPITNIIRLLSEDEKLKSFPDAELSKVIEARNAVYHRAVYHTHSTCTDFMSTTGKCLTSMSTNYLGISFQELTLVSLVEDIQVRTFLSNAEKHLGENNLVDAVIDSCQAFAAFRRRLRERGRHYIESRMRDIGSSHKISWRYVTNKYVLGSKLPDMTGLADHVEEQVNAKLTDLGIESDFAAILGFMYEDYKHFVSIRPLYHETLGGFICEREIVEKRGYKLEEGRFIFNFVLKMVLYLEPRLRPLELRALSGEVYQVIK